MNSIKCIPRIRGNNSQTKYIINRKFLKHVKVQLRHCNTALSELQELKEADFWNKVIYNEVLNKIAIKKKIKKTDTSPIFLKYLSKDNEVVENCKTEESEEPEPVSFPYEINKRFLKDIENKNDLNKTFPETIYNFTPSDDEKIEPLQWGSEDIRIDKWNLENPEKWVSKFPDQLENDNIEEVFKFGSSNPHQKVSSVPCGGCGAFLHCNDPSIPGFIPAEIFEDKTEKELRAETCQRCLFLREFDVSLGVNVSPSEYIKILSAIKEKQALAILMVDMLDFPCSLFPGILDIIGPTKPVVIVGNKVDLLIQEDDKCLRYFKTALLKELKKQGIKLQNVKHVSLISAKTGFGIEELINQLHLNWGFKGDVYLIGCTNVGKSTLFNTLIRSDYCKVKATNILQRATISAWPGTTLNLLKFPILKPTKSRLISRLLRLKSQEKEEAALQKYQWMGQNIKLEQIPLKGHVGRTFNVEPNPDTSFEQNNSLGDIKREGLDPKAFEFQRSKWFYDTPGVVHQDQIVNLLTASELLLTVPQKMLLPRNFRLKPGHSLFIAGIGRLDYVSGADFVWFTVFASMELPITVTKTEDADYVYKKLLGSPYFRVPTKGKERLAKWPDLSSKKFEIPAKVDRFKLMNGILQQSKLSDEASADVVLSSAGWIAITVPYAYRCNIEVWTPEGKGIYLRDYPIIRTGCTFRGPKIRGTPAFENSVKEVTGFSVTDEPP